MNEEISLASHMQLDSDKKWEAISESLDSLGELTFNWEMQIDGVFF